MKRTLVNLRDDIRAWGSGWLLYVEHKISAFAYWFETNKDNLVGLLMARRGTYQRPFLYFSLSILFVVGMIGGPILAKTYPGGLPGALAEFTPPSAVVSSLDLTNYGVQTQISDKPRDQVITYTVIAGDTLSKVAEKFGISVDTVRWANDLKGDTLSTGDQLKIPPVSGIVHKVTEGETIYSIAKKYKTDAQKIINFPFNDFADLDTFALNVGQTLIVPDGVQPQAPAIAAPLPPVLAGGTGQFSWPVSGVITQYPVWYHMAFDIANPSLPGIAAAADGVVSLVRYLRYDYGEYVIIDHGNGFSTLYAHMSEIYVKVGDKVVRGQIIGKMGSTGRSTGPHVHFEVRVNGVPVDPRPYLK